MNYLIATLHTLGFRVRDNLDQAHETVRRHGREEGSVTIEQVLWAIAMIAIVGIVVVAITSYVTKKSGDLGGGTK